MEENRIPKRVLCMNLGTTRLRGRPRNRWQDEVRVDGGIVCGEGWQEKVYNREEWKKLLRTARNCRILHVPMEWMNISNQQNIWKILYSIDLHLRIILFNDQLDAQLCFIYVYSILYVFRAFKCSSSGDSCRFGQNVQTCIPDGHLHRVT